MEIISAISIYLLLMLIVYVGIRIYNKYCRWDQEKIEGPLILYFVLLSPISILAFIVYIPFFLIKHLLDIILEEE